MRVTIRNDTPRILELTGPEGRRLVLAPLERREIEIEGEQPEVTKEDVAGFDLSEAISDGKVSWWSERPSEIGEKILGILYVVAVALAMACGVASSRNAPSWFGSQGAWQLFVWIAGGVLLGLVVAALVIHKTQSFRLVARFLAQRLSLVVILAIGLGLPTATVYYFGGGKSLLADPSSELFARLLQVGFIATASLLPVLLFFLFDRYQLSTLRDRLYRDLFRLDRGLKTRSEIDAKYGSQIREAYGPEDQGRGRLAPGTRWPVLVCAFVVTMGWLAAFRPVGAIDATTVQKPLFPEQTALTFGFLGAYFFGLQLIARRYSRGDLKPKAYGYITIRILTVAVLSWTLEVIFSADSTMKLLCAFLIGILPDEFFTLIREQFRNRGPGLLVPESEKHPLTKLEGIDLYDRARLEQEGIVNVESFAHHELIDLVLETRVPVPQLVDWMDQAILYLHLIQEPADTAPPKLRNYGIRTATDLLTCWDAAEKRSDSEFKEFKELLGKDKPYRLEVIRDALLDDEWLARLQDWRRDSEREPKTVKAFPQSFEAKLKWGERLLREERYQGAIDMFSEAIAIHDDAGARVRLAHVFARSPVLELRDKNHFRSHAERAFELGQGNVAVLKDLIEIYDEKEDTGGAIRACDAAILVLRPLEGDKDVKKAIEALEERRKRLEEKEKKPRPSVQFTPGPS